MDAVAKISGISQASRSEMRNVLVKISASPAAVDFWTLSRMFSMAEVDALESVKSWALELLSTNKSKFLGASFALARLHARLGLTPVPSLSVPVNPGFAVDLLHTADVNDSRLPDLLNFPNRHVQRVAASLIARHSNREAIDEILKSKIHESGRVQLLSQSLDEERPVRFYFSFLRDMMKHPSATEEAQKSLAALMRNHPASFHCLNCLELVEQEFEKGSLVPEFFDACLRCYGLFAIRRFEASLVLKIVATGNPDMIEPLVSVLGNMSVQTQFSVQQTLVDLSQKRPLDGIIHVLTAKAIIASAPAVSPSTGRFMDVANRSPESRAVKNLLRGVLEPSGAAPLCKLLAVVVVDEKDKRTAEAQACPEYSAVEVQVGE